MATNKIFFAYESNHTDNIDAIKTAAGEFNRHQKTYNVSTWEDLRNNGHIIGKKVMEAIDNAVIFACDLTYLNHNVFFELGYAIAKKKELEIFLNTSVVGAKDNYSNLDILRTIGYTEFSNSKQILTELQKKSKKDKVLIDEVIQNFDEIEEEYDIFLINSKTKNQAGLDLEEYFSLDNKYITNNPMEIEYQPLAWYLSTIKKSKIVLLHMVGQDKEDYQVTNAEFSLYAGIALGLQKSIAFLAPYPFKAPIDYSEMLMEYYNAKDCIDKIEYWYNAQKKTFENNESNVPNKDVNNSKELNILKLGLGVGIAEKDDLGSCFIETKAFEEIQNTRQRIVIGRKGTGKTAIFFKLQEEMETNKNVYNIILKPDSSEIIDNVELTKLYDNQRSKKAFLKTVWDFIIISKIFQQLYERKNLLDMNDKQLTEFDSLYEKNSDLFNLNFYAMINHLSLQIGENSLMTNPAILEKINRKLIPVSSFCKNFFKEKKYQKINILADNLDLGWDAKNDLDLQSSMIIELLEYIESFSNNISANVNTKIFLRKDIFNYLLRQVREADKLSIDSYELNWEQFPEQLKMVLEERFKNALEAKEVEKVWKEYFHFSGKTEPFKIIIEKVVKRPRDVIYFVSKLFESAVNRNKTVVDNEDLDYAVNAYMNFLYTNLIAEFKAEFPEIEKILKLLQETNNEIFKKDSEISFNKFRNILIDAIIEEERVNKFIQRLFENGYITGLYQREKINNYEIFINKYKEQHKDVWNFIKFWRRNNFAILFRLKPVND